MTDAPAKNGNGLAGSPLAWAAIVLSLASAFWAVANPRDDIKQVEARLMNDAGEIKRRLDNYLGRDVHLEFALRKDKDTDRLQTEIDHINSDMVSRNEHIQHWNQIEARLNALRDQNMRLEAELTGSYNIGKQLDNLQRQVDDLRKIKIPVSP